MTNTSDSVNRRAGLSWRRNELLTFLRELSFNQEGTHMAADPLATIRKEIGLRVAEIRGAGLRLSPLDLHARMDAIRQLAATHGLTALEGLARGAAQRALLPGHRVAMQSCLEHVDEALDSHSASDCNTILAALAIRLH
jgi:hypothetical protein